MVQLVSCASPVFLYQPFHLEHNFHLDTHLQAFLPASFPQIGCPVFDNRLLALVCPPTVISLAKVRMLRRGAVRLCLWCSILSLASAQSGVLLVHSTFLLALVVPHILWFVLSSVTFVPIDCIGGEKEFFIWLLPFLSVGSTMTLDCNTTVCIRLRFPTQAVLGSNAKAKPSVFTHCKCRLRCNLRRLRKFQLQLHNLLALGQLL